MRATIRMFVVAAAVSVLAVPAPALANGGAYFELKETYSVWGSTAVATYEVQVPARRWDLLDRGPFWLYLVPERSWIEAGEPIPSDAIQVGAASIERRGERVTVDGSFVVPEVAQGGYSLQMCNDPCTLDGFGEPVSGFLTVVATPYEAALLRRQGDLQRKIRQMGRDVRLGEERAEQLEETGVAISDSLVDRTRELLDARAQIDDLQAAPSPRPLVSTWAAVALAMLIGLGVGASLKGSRAKRQTPHREAQLPISDEVASGSGTRPMVSTTQGRNPSRS